MPPEKVAAARAAKRGHAGRLNRLSPQGPRVGEAGPRWRGSAVFVRRAQRSTSPNTTSSEPRIAATSASMWPSHMESMACRCAKPGALILQR